jgi:primosomal replication protein N
MLKWMQAMLGLSQIEAHVKNIEKCNAVLEHKSRNVEQKLEPLAELVVEWLRQSGRTHG